MSTRGERLLGVAGLVAAAAIPVILFHDLLGKVASTSSRASTGLLTGASGFVLMAAGLVAVTPVVISIGLTPDSRLYPRSRGSLAGWGVSLYLLGTMLLLQIGAIADLVPDGPPKLRCMGRFREPPDPVFHALNASIAFDRRLGSTTCASPRRTSRCSRRPTS